MSQFKHDRFFKRYIQALYGAKGTFSSNLALTAGEDLFIDVLFEPNLNLPAWQKQRLGLLDLLMGHCSQTSLVVEHYSEVRPELVV